MNPVHRRRIILIGVAVFFIVWGLSYVIEPKPYQGPPVRVGVNQAPGPETSPTFPAQSAPGVAP